MKTNRMILVAFENVSCVNFVSHVVEAYIVAVGHNGIGELLEFSNIIYHFAAEEGCAVI